MITMSFFDSMNVSASGLTAQRLRMDVISQNLANVNTTRAANGKPYKRKIALFQEQNKSTQFGTSLENVKNNNLKGNGVRISRIVEDLKEGAKVYDLGHPDADEDGYVTMPNVNTVEEMVNMISASRSYEANVTSLTTTKTMMAKTLELGR
jgi:flagellar basal-body rod protein FlgC